MIDIYHTRRGHFKLCKYWNRNEDDSVGDLTKWIIDRKPEGMFYAKQVNAHTNQASQLNNVLMFDKNMVTISTNDIVDTIKRGSVVQYLGKVWLVQSVQFEQYHKESEFDDEKYTTYISLTR